MIPTFRLLLFLLLGALLLRAEQKEIEDHDHQQHGDEQARERIGAARGTLREGRSDEHGLGFLVSVKAGRGRTEGFRPDQPAQFSGGL